MSKDNIEPFLIFSDGTFAILDGMKKIVKTDNNGNKTEQYEVYIRPTERTRKKWNITPSHESFVNEGDYTGTYKRYYNVDYGHPLDVNPRSAVWLFFCDWNNKMIDPVNGAITFWRDKLEKQKQIEKGLRAITISMARDMITFTKHPMLFAEKYGKKLRRIMDDIQTFVPPSMLQQTGGEQNG